MKEYDIDSGAAIAADTPAPTVGFARIRLDLIVTSRTNPRTTFDQVKLQELAASIAGLDVMQPILMRPLPADRLADTAFATDAAQLLLKDWPHLESNKRYPRPAYEIVSGERRYRACILAGKLDIPAMVKAMTDQEVLEAQLVENLQRDDLHPMEEAEGYRRLCDTTGIKKEDVGTKIGKSRSYVYQRLHLLALGQEAREAFRAGKLDASKAVLLASVGDPKLQLKALNEATREDYDGRTPAVRVFRAWLLDNVMLKLDHAPFDIKDVTLNAEAGACGVCPKRTGVDRDIFAEFDSPDMCTDAKCYGTKATVSLQRIKDAAADKGMTVIAGVEAKKLRPQNWSEEIKGYTRLDDKVEGGGTVAQMLGKSAPAPVVFVDPHTHQPVKVLPNAVVGELLKAKGIEIGTPKDTKDQALERAKEETKRQERAAYENAWRARAASAVDAAVRGGAIASFSANVLRRLCALLLDSMDSDDTDPLLPLWGLPLSDKDDWRGRNENNEALERHVQAAPDADLGRMVLDLLMADELTVHPYRPDVPTPSLDLLAGEAGVDLAVIQREVKVERKAAAKAAAAPPPGAKVKAAPQGSIEQDGGKAAKGKPTAARGKRLSAEEAKSGIAEAMQGVDEPEAGAEDPWALKVGVAVKVNDTATGPHQKKWIGKTGEVTTKQGDNAWHVTFPGRKGGSVVTFDASELTAVPA